MAKVRVLIVGEDSTGVNDLKKQLSDLGYPIVAIATSKTDAIKKVEAIKPDIVLIDVKLEGNTDGIETAKKIQNRFNTPIVYLTSYSDPDTIRSTLKTKPYGYVVKPLDGRELEVALRKAHLIKQMEAGKLERYRGKILKQQVRKILAKRKKLLKDKLKTIDDKLWSA